MVIALATRCSYCKRLIDYEALLKLINDLDSFLDEDEFLLISCANIGCISCTGRNRRYIRHQRRRIIKRRSRILGKFGWNMSKPGKYAKHNGNCGCVMCHYDKIYGFIKPKYKLRKEDMEYE